MAEDGQPLTGQDEVSLGGWLTDLTYGEVHAFIWGAGITAIAATGRPEFWGLYVALMGYAFGFDIMQRVDPRINLDLVPDYVRRQIRRQVHYYIAGGAVGYAAPVIVIEFATQYLPF